MSTRGPHPLHEPSGFWRVVHPGAGVGRARRTWPQQAGGRRRRIFQVGATPRTRQVRLLFCSTIISVSAAYARALATETCHSADMLLSSCLGRRPRPKPKRPASADSTTLFCNPSALAALPLPNFQHRSHQVFGQIFFLGNPSIRLQILKIIFIILFPRCSIPKRYNFYWKNLIFASF